jgi:hypothetical protein
LLIYSGKDLQLSQYPHRELPQCDEDQHKNGPPIPPRARLLNPISHHLPDVPYHRIATFALNPDAVTWKANDTHGSPAVSDGHGIALSQRLPAQQGIGKGSLDGY